MTTRGRRRWPASRLRIVFPSVLWIPLGSSGWAFLGNPRRGFAGNRRDVGSVTGFCSMDTCQCRRFQRRKPTRCPAPRWSTLLPLTTWKRADSMAYRQHSANRRGGCQPDAGPAKKVRLVSHPVTILRLVRHCLRVSSAPRGEVVIVLPARGPRWELSVRNLGI